MTETTGEKILRLTKELKEMEKVQAQEKAAIKHLYTSNQVNIAELLHKKMCRHNHTDGCGHNHTDGCGWYYDTGDWKEFSRKEYMDKAITLLSSFSYLQCLSFIKIL